MLSGVAPPDMELFPPWGTMGTRWRAHRATKAESWPVVSGEARPIARPSYRPRQSVSHGCMTSGSVVHPALPRRSKADAAKESVSGMRPICHSQ